LRVFVAALTVLSLVAVGHAQSSYQTFLSELKAAVRRDDRAAVASLIEFPIIVRMAGVRLPFPSSTALLERYGDIFTPELRVAIDRVDLNAFVIEQVNGRYKLTSITVPPHEDSVGSTSPPHATTAPAPRRIGVRAGPQPTQFAGGLAPGATDVYLLFVPKGRRLEVRLERVGRAAIARVQHAGTRAPLNPLMPNGALVVSGRAPSDGDYRIEVAHTTAADSSYLPYFLSVDLR
jgi:hypothetical protein